MQDVTNPLSLYLFT